MGASRPHLGGFQEPLALDFEGSRGVQNSVFRSLLALATCNFDLQALSPLKTNSASHVRLGQLLRYAFITAMTTLLHFPPLLFLPFRCGGLCAAHGIDVPQNLHFFVDFLPFRNALQNLLRKNIEKLRKSRISGSQNPPQILPKCLPNRRSQKTTIFHCFFT